MKHLAQTLALGTRDEVQSFVYSVVLVFTALAAVTVLASVAALVRPRRSLGIVALAGSTMMSAFFYVGDVPWWFSFAMGLGLFASGWAFGRSTLALAGDGHT